ncbi:hypothetical protein GCM10018790_63620 [Kitasatospora xanthocidica]|nr:hypothetical protein GCM10018790_63620 [Kitasatospora xanthocidica]
MFSSEAWARVRLLHEGGMPIKQIAHREGMAPNTVRRLVRAAEAPRYRRSPRPPVSAPFEARILRLLKEQPSRSAAEIGRRIRWPASQSLLRAEVARLRPLVTVPVLRQRLVPELAPGWAECGLWLPEGPVEVGAGQRRRCPVVLMVAGDSGRLAARAAVSSKLSDVWAAQHHLLHEWGGVPHTVRWDPQGIDVPSWSWDEGTGWSTYRMQAELGSTTVEFVDEGTTVSNLLATARRYLTAACPPDRSFTSPEDLAAALHTWQEDFHRSWDPDRTARWAAERSALFGGPSAAHPLLQPPPDSHRTRVQPDSAGYVRAAGNDYLVGEWGARRRLTVKVTDVEVVICSGGYHAGGFHTVVYARSWAQRMQVTVPLRHELIEPSSGVRREVDGP